MSKLIDRLVVEIVADDIKLISKMKKANMVKLMEIMLKDNLRELTDETIIDVYEEKFNTNLVR